MKTDFLSKKELPLKDLMPIICEHLQNGRQVKLSPKGTSMLPMIRQGRDSVILSPINREIKKYDIVLYLRKNGQYVLHRVIKVGKTLTFAGDNQIYIEKGIDRSQAIAIVDEFYRGNRHYSIDNFLYKAYYIVHHYLRPLRRVYRALGRRVKKYWRIICGNKETD